MTILSRVYKFFGWSPIGKFVEVKVDESSFPSLIGKTLSAKVVSLKDQGVAVLEMPESIKRDLGGVHLVTARSRHKGYDFYHLRIGAIAVDLSPIEETSRLELQDKRFVTGLMWLSREL